MCSYDSFEDSAEDFTFTDAGELHNIKMQHWDSTVARDECGDSTSWEGEEAGGDAFCR